MSDVAQPKGSGFLVETSSSPTAYSSRSKELKQPDDHGHDEAIPDGQGGKGSGSKDGQQTGNDSVALSSERSVTC